jgi:hypothetical protein
MNAGIRYLMSHFSHRSRARMLAPPPRVNLTLMQWREREDLVAAAAKLQADPNFRLQLEVLHNESPSNYQNLAMPAERTLGQIEGYNMAMNNLAALAVLPDGSAPIESTFEDRNQELK